MIDYNQKSTSKALIEMIVQKIPPHMRRSRISGWFLLFGLTLLLAGCAPTAQIALTDIHSLPPEERIVFGRVDVHEGDKSIEWSKKLFGPGNFDVVVLPESSSRAVYYQLSGDGTFYWRLLPGKYAIAAFEWQSGNTLTGRIFAEFTVPQEKEPVYIGTLRIIFAGSRYGVFIVDEYERAVGAFREKIPRAGGAPIKSLMELEVKP
jgi:hypothetical protein